MFWVRFRSSILLMVITIFLMVMGGNVLFAGLLLISWMGMMELYRIFDFHKTLLGAVGYLAAAGYYAMVYFGRTELALLGLTGFLIALMAVYVLTFPKYKADQVMAAFFGLFYVAVMISFIYQVRIAESGAYLVWLIFICSWGCDTCAYCVGILIGKHKMAPVLSPKKSVEGGIGGVVGAALIGVIYASILREHITIFANPVLFVAILSAAGAVISQIGDLAASAIKRNYEIKDYGKLIPGHGGILDRFDSVIITAPIIFALMQVFG
ncbi:phosphatidate cytidylyltransferase [Hominifimenecus sp. rT4P-3]|uniref:phosphatidate cytidylyltransferase n=1 Tax=Hominifimenecus sp. rT4P-3 TaxID=3242979 RepID=UPI003DA3B99D